MAVSAGMFMVAPCAARRVQRADVKIADERPVIGQRDLGNRERFDLDALRVKDEVEFHARLARRVRRQARDVGAAQPARLHEQGHLVFAPERVEVASHDHRLGRFLHQLEHLAQLGVAVPELERQVHEEDAHVVELELDDQPLDAGVEIVEALALDPRRGQEGIGLLVHDRHERVERARAVLALVGGVMAQRFGDDLGLVDVAGADRPGVDLDQADDVGVVPT